MTPHEYVQIASDLEAAINRLHTLRQVSFDWACGCEIPKNLRPATPGDVVVGAVIWKPDWEDKKWSIVEKVLQSDDLFKAWVADDGCTYGLHRAFIEEK